MAIRVFSLPFAALLLSACSGNYDFSSNLDREPIKNYFAVGNVAVIEAAPAAAQSLGFVDGTSCQSSAQLPPASEADARTELRRAAAELSANAVVISQCVALDGLPGCVSAVQCSGQALKTQP